VPPCACHASRSPAAGCAGDYKGEHDRNFRRPVGRGQDGGGSTSPAAVIPGRTAPPICDFTAPHNFSSDVMSLTAAFDNPSGKPTVHRIIAEDLIAPRPLIPFKPT